VTVSGTEARDAAYEVRSLMRSSSPTPARVQARWLLLTAPPTPPLRDPARLLDDPPGLRVRRLAPRAGGHGRRRVEHDRRPVHPHVGDRRGRSRSTSVTRRSARCGVAAGRRTAWPISASGSSPAPTSSTVAELRGWLQRGPSRGADGPGPRGHGIGKRSRRGVLEADAVRRSGCATASLSHAVDWL
jgi:hypothetical protein